MPPVLPPADDNHRLATLLALGILDTGPEESFDTLAQCAAQLTGCPIAAISLIDEHREWFKALHGWSGPPVSELPRAVSFCSHALRADGLLEVPDATRDAALHDNPFVLGAPHIRFYAGAPLRVNDITVGALCVLDTQARPLSSEARAALMRLARLASDLLVHRQTRPMVDEERTRLLDFARASGDWMWETDDQLRYTWVSPNFETVTQLPAHEMRGRLLADAPMLDGLGEPLSGERMLHALMERRQPISRVITEKPTPRGVLKVSRSAVPVFDDQGRFRGYRGTARDVSSHIEAEQRAHEQAEHLRKLTAQVPGVIYQFWLQPDGRVHYTYASEASRAMFGAAPPRKDDGGDRRAVCQQLHPDDTGHFMPSLVAASRALRPWQSEFRIVRNGELRWIESRATPEPHPGGGTMWTGFSADITARKETELALRSSEARWGLAADAAGIGIAEFELAGGRMRLDARACAIHGLKFPQTELDQHHWLDAIHPEDRPHVQARFDLCLATGSTLEARYRLHRHDGSEATVEIFARCTYGPELDVAGLIGTCRDMTQQVAHEQLRADKEAAERASRAKSEFLSRVSHELRTPLNGILGFAQLMAVDAEEPLPSGQAHRLDNVLRAGRHLLDLINDMLNLARIEQSDFSLEEAPVNLTATLQACFAIIQPLADTAGVRLVPPARRAHWARADARAVEQVLLNLLSNAIKYNRPGGAVRVALTRSGAGIQVAVSDEGEGLSAEQQTHLFQPFNRLGAEHKRVEGTGLGLVIARELAASMRGELRVRSELGKGSTFSLLLPAGAAPAPPREPDAGDASTRPPAPDAQRRVLYIEDEPLNVLLMQEVFKSRPRWQLDIATDGHAGLEAARAHGYDLLLIDMNLPDMNGLELIRTLRGEPRGALLQCIALSADAMQAQIDAALAAGFDGYWTKPINVVHILEGLGQALAN